MLTRLEQMFVVSCPFCHYRAMFLSDVVMHRTYEAHLRRHEEEAFEDGRSGGQRARQWVALAELHVQRLKAAGDN